MKLRDLPARAAAAASALRFRISGEKQFVFIHIPKTGGTSLMDNLAAGPHRDRFLRSGHRTPRDRIRSMGRNWRYFICMRHPMDWYVSFYAAKFRVRPDDAAKDYHRMPGNQWPDFFDDFVLRKNGREGVRKWQKPWEPHYDEMLAGAPEDLGFFTLHFLYYASLHRIELLRQPDPVACVLSSPADWIHVDHILQLSDLQAGFDSMMKQEGMDIRADTRQRSNESARRPMNEYYTPEMARQVRQGDRLLYQLFHYPETPSGN